MPPVVTSSLSNLFGVDIEEFVHNTFIIAIILLFPLARIGISCDSNVINPTIPRSVLMVNVINTLTRKTIKVQVITGASNSQAEMLNVFTRWLVSSPL